LPGWLRSETFDSDQIAAIMRQHINTLVGRYRRQIAIWDVVNEAFDWDGRPRETVWQKAMGEGYIDAAFQIAREADPAAKLFYSDYANEGLGRKSDAIYELVRGMRARNVPIDGVAFHLHVRLDERPRLDDMAQNIARLHQLGLEVHISEMDVRLQDVNMPIAEKLDQQAQVYRDVLDVCLKSPGCTSFGMWGFTDQYSWIPKLTGNPDAPLIFDERYKPKPAYQALADRLRTCCADGGRCAQS
jgi:endo-1,4-beta-xylanase